MTATGPSSWPTYLIGMATATSRSSITPTTYAITRYRPRAACTLCGTAAGAWVEGSAATVHPLPQGLRVQLGEVGVVGGQFRIAGGVDPRTLVEDDRGAGFVLGRVPPQLVANHPQIEAQAHEAVERPLQGVAPVDRTAACLGLAQLPVAQEEGRDEQRRDQQVHQHPAPGQEASVHSADCSRRAWSCAAVPDPPRTPSVLR